MQYVFIKDWPFETEKEWFKWYEVFQGFKPGPIEVYHHCDNCQKTTTWIIESRAKFGTCKGCGIKTRYHHPIAQELL